MPGNAPFGAAICAPKWRAHAIVTARVLFGAGLMMSALADLLVSVLVLNDDAKEAVVTFEVVRDKMPRTIHFADFKNSTMARCSWPVMLARSRM